VLVVRRLARRRLGKLVVNVSVAVNEDFSARNVTLMSSLHPASPHATLSPGLIDNLNRYCACRTLDPEGLQAALLAIAPNTHEALASRPHLFAATTVFLSAMQRARIVEIIHTIEQVVSLPSFREQALAEAPRSLTSILDRVASSWVSIFT